MSDPLAAIKKTGYRPARPLVKLTPGQAVRMTRELQELSQTQLSKICGIKQTEISAIEKGRTTLGADRAVKLARALRVHPAVLLFPSWEEEEPAKRAARA